MKIRYLLIFISFSIPLSAQTFLNNTGGKIEEVGVENLYPVSVTGLQASIDTPSFGVISICFNIIHTYDADLDISLRAPDGTTVKLSNNNGFDGDNYTGTCVMENAINGEISAMSAPFTGNYYPDAYSAGFARGGLPTYRSQRLTSPKPADIRFGRRNCTVLRY